MARRYYLCDVLGTGTRTDPYRPALADLVPPVPYAVVLPTDPATGAPTSADCLVVVAGGPLVHARVRNAAGVDPLPDLDLGDPVTTLGPAARTAIRAMLARRGFPAALLDEADGLRDLVRGVGRRLDPGFHEDHLDVSDE